MIQWGREQHKGENTRRGESVGPLETCCDTELCDSSPYSLREESENRFHSAIPQMGVWEGHGEEGKPMGNYT